MMTSLSGSPRFVCRDTSDVPRRGDGEGHLITHITFLRAQSLRGHTRRSSLTLCSTCVFPWMLRNHQSHRPALWQESSKR
jgi:hypothetical protein